MVVNMDNTQLMRFALEQAREACDGGDVPVGALVVDARGQVIGRGFNRRERDADPLAHAELLALRGATQHRISLMHRGRIASATDDDGRRLGGAGWNLSGCTLVVTLEPCPMCAGAAMQAHVDRIVFGAWDAKLGACGSVWDIPRDPHVGHRAEVIGGVLNDECATLLRAFFAAHRSLAAADDLPADAERPTSPD